MGNGISSLLAPERFGSSNPAASHFAGTDVQRLLTDMIGRIDGGLGIGLGPQRQPTPLPMFNAYGPYGLLAAQMAGRAGKQSLLGGGMPSSRIPYRPYGK